MRVPLACGPQICSYGLCINTHGSYQCLASKNLSFCGAPSPASCTSAGGSQISIQLVNTSYLRSGASSVVGLNLSDSTVPVQMKQSSFRFTCPPSKSVGVFGVQLLRADGSALCSFNFAFVPGPAPINPPAFRLRGGLLHLNIGEYFEFYGRRTCTITGGSVNIPFFLNRTVVEFIVPPSDQSGLIPLFLTCKGIPSSIDLQVQYQYVAPSSISMTGAQSCVQFEECVFIVVVSNPPPEVSQDSLTFLVENGNLVSVPPHTNTEPMVQVCSMDSSF